MNNFFQMTLLEFFEAAEEISALSMEAKAWLLALLVASIAVYSACLRIGAAISSHWGKRETQTEARHATFAGSASRISNQSGTKLGELRSNGDVFDTSGTRVGYVSGGDVFRSSGGRAGYFQSNGDVFASSSGSRVGYVKSNGDVFNIGGSRVGIVESPVNPAGAARLLLF